MSYENLRFISRGCHGNKRERVCVRCRKFSWSRERNRANRERERKRNEVKEMSRKFNLRINEHEWRLASFDTHDLVTHYCKEVFHHLNVISLKQTAIVTFSDRSGAIGLDELEAAMKNLGLESTKDQLTKIIDEVIIPSNDLENLEMQYQCENTVSDNNFFLVYSKDGMLL